MPWKGKDVQMSKNHCGMFLTHEVGAVGVQNLNENSEFYIIFGLLTKEVVGL